MKLPQIRNGKWVPITHKIAVVGVSGSGKTVFLTSLIHHLKRASSNFELRLRSFDDGRSPVNIQYLADIDQHNLPLDELIKNELADETESLAVQSQEPFQSQTRTISSFPYEMNRDAMARGHDWPSKTTDFSRFGCRVNFTLDGRCSGRRLWLFDIPGERLADVEIARCKGYQDWSTGVILSFLSNEAFKACARDFLKLMNAADLKAEQVLRAYKEMLWRAYRCYMDTITPSVFRLDTKGNPLDWDPPDENFIFQRHSGLIGKEFAPLTAECIVRNPQLASQFALHYRQYREEVVDSLLRVLGSCDGLVLLVDIVSILKGGLAAFMATQKLLDRLFDFLSDRGKLASRLLRTTTFRTNLKNIAVVAPKLDLISTGDVQNSVMVGLLRELTVEPLQKSGLHRMNVRHFQCSAVKAAEVVPNSETEDAYQLRGYKRDSAETMTPSDKILRLPKIWESDWEAGTYRIPDGRCDGYLPHPPLNPIYPPEQSGLDEILAFVLEGSI